MNKPKDFRSKPTGWRYESHRHSLAARGISSRSYLARSRLSYSSDLSAISKPSENLRPTHKASCSCQYCATRKELLVGGRADGRQASEFDKEQLRKGIAHEMEHTNDPKKAEEIAMDHLAEDPKYYDHLDTMELAVKTGKPVVYAASVEGTAKFLKSIVDDGRPKTEDFTVRMQHEEIEKVGSEVRTDLRRAEDAGQISAKDSDKFMKDDFTSLTKDFLAGDIDRGRYRDEVRRLLERHKKMHSKTLSILKKEGDDSKSKAAPVQQQAAMLGQEPESLMPEKKELPFNPLTGDAEKSQGAFTFFAKRSSPAQKEYNEFVRVLKIQGDDRPDLSKHYAQKAWILEQEHTDLKKDPLVEEWKNKELYLARRRHS